MCGESGRSILTVMVVLTCSCGLQSVRTCGTWIVTRTSIYGAGAGCATAICLENELLFSASSLLRRANLYRGIPDRQWIHTTESVFDLSNRGRHEASKSSGNLLISWKVDEP